VRCGVRTDWRQRGGIVFRLLIWLTVFFAFVALAWMMFLPVVLTTRIRTRTGFDATVGRVVVNPFSGRIEVQGLVIENPPTFPVRDFVRLREFRAKVDPWSTLSGRPVIDAMTVNVESITVVKREDGASNAEAFGRHLSSDRPDPRPPSVRGPRPFLVRHLAVHIDRVIAIDRNRRKPTQRDFEVKFDQNYTNVSDPKQLFGPSAMESLAPLGELMAQLMPGDLGAVFSDGAKKEGGLFREAGRKTEAQAKRLFDALEESQKP